MSIFDSLRRKPTYMFAIDSIRPTDFKIRSEDTGRIKDYEISKNKEWIVSLTVSQNYWANDAQRDSAEKIAIECIAQALYNDVLPFIPRLKLAIQSGLKMDALRIVCEMERAMRP
jgi:hypothetical protein